MRPGRRRGRRDRCVQARKLGLIEKIDWVAVNPAPMFPEAKNDYGFGYQYFSTIMAWRKGAKEPHNIYDIIPDSKNNVYFTDFRHQHIGRLDAKTGEVKLFEAPVRGSAPRRGMMDPKDRLWFGMYRGDRIGMFDTNTAQFNVWQLKTRWASPYDVVLDKNEEAWTGSMLTDQVTRLNTKTDEMVDYLLPRTTNIRRVFVDNTTTPVTFWVGSNHGASVIKLEPLD